MTIYIIRRECLKCGWVVLKTKNMTKLRSFSSLFGREKIDGRVVNWGGRRKIWHQFWLFTNFSFSIISFLRLRQISCCHLHQFFPALSSLLLLSIHFSGEDEYASTSSCAVRYDCQVEKWTLFYNFKFSSGINSAYRDDFFPCLKLKNQYFHS